MTCEPTGAFSLSPRRAGGRPAGDQIDRQVNPALPPILSDGTALGASRPAPRLTSNDFWAQGLTLGVQLAY